MSAKIEKIALFTSGGDSPGMNAAIRAVVRTALYYKLQAYGIWDGYEGMIDGNICKLSSKDVGNIIQRGGTILRSSRSKRFVTLDGMQQAYLQLQKHAIDAVVAIGGDGTFKGALEFSTMHNVPFVGIPGTIDNDLYGTDYTLGYDTAINTAMEAIDKLRDTANSHNRLFFVEVMGRDTGFIALRSGLGGAAEAILIPEMKTDINHLIEILKQGYKQKASMIVVVAEGDDAGNASDIASKVKKELPDMDTRISVLGHIQRGGRPTCQDRVLGSRMGFEAIKALLRRENQVMMGLEHKNIVSVPFEKATKHHTKVNEQLLNLTEILSGIM